MSEHKKSTGKPNHGRVYHLSDMATQKNIKSILNPVTRNMMEYRHLIADPTIREVWEKLSANEFGRLMNGSKMGTQGTETTKFI